MSSYDFLFSKRWKVYAGIATNIPAPVATKASLIAGAITDKLAFEVPIFVKVSSIPTTVPKSPIKGDVEAIIDNQVSPDVEFFSAIALQTESFSFVVSPVEYFLTTVVKFEILPPSKRESSALISDDIHKFRDIIFEIKIEKVVIK